MTTLLLDADIIAFKVASVSQRTFQFPGCEPSVVADEWEQVVPRIDSEVAKLTEKLKSDKVIVCLSCPTEDNWRLKILPTYKGNRDYSKRPVWLAKVKDYLEAEYPSYRRPHLEADDIMGILSTMPGLPPGFLKDNPGFDPKARKVIVSEDKDLKNIPGWLFNPAKDSKPHQVSLDDADRWHLYQALMGDTTDGYKGCPGCGPKGAERVLDKAPGVYAWPRVVARFAKAGLTEADALVQARVSRICRFTDYDFKNKEVIPWTPK
jgi:DNA polymerase-1